MREELSTIDRLLFRHARWNEEMHGALFEFFGERNADTVACVMYLLFCIALLFSVGGWFILPAPLMIAFDVMFAAYLTSSFISHCTPPFSG